MNTTIKKDERKDRLGLLTETAPQIVFINRAGNVYSVTEHYHSPRRKPYKRYSIDTPEDYVHRGDEVVIIDDLEN